jgi:hypothetical protein
VTEARAARVAAVIGAVARQCLADRGARRVALLDDGSPEAVYAARVLREALGEGAVVRVAVDDADLEPLLHLGGPRARLADEARRMRARLLEGAVAAHPAHKTELLLGPSLPPDPLLPLGDLYASEVAELAGGWSASDEVRALAGAAGAWRRWTPRSATAWRAATPRRWTRSGGPPPLRGRPRRPPGAARGPQARHPHPGRGPARVTEVPSAESECRVPSNFRPAIRDQH